jgi:hypothetical protein
MNKEEIRQLITNNRLATLSMTVPNRYAKCRHFPAKTVAGARTGKADGQSIAWLPSSTPAIAKSETPSHISIIGTQSELFSLKGTTLQSWMPPFHPMVKNPLRIQ